jgi:hypothetical protein
MSNPTCILKLLAVALLLLWTAQAMAQSTPEPTDPDPGVTEPTQAEPDGDEPEPAEPEDEAPSAGNPPPYITELVEGSELTPEQMAQMRADGAGWGNIRIATRLAEQIAADSAGTDTPLTFDEALAIVLAARAEGLGFGEIANANNVKIGQLMRHRNQVQEPAQGDGLEAEEGVQAGEAVQTRGRKRGLLARLAGFLGFGKAKRPDKAGRPVQVAGNADGQATGKPDKPSKPEKPERPRKFFKPEKLERPERPAKPEKPEKPERGPRR